MTAKFAFVSAERGSHAVAMLCRVVGASVSGFYAWLRAIPSLQHQAEAEAELRGHIGRIFAAKRGVYGSPRIGFPSHACDGARHAELRREGRRHARRRVARLMRDMGLSARQGRKRPPRTTNSRHDLPVAPNLLARNFAADRPDQVWLADISYIATDEGWLYLAVVGAICLRALPGRARAYGIVQSMSQRGNCLDNAPMESLFAALKTEHVHLVRFRSRAEAKAAVFEYLEVWYNRVRSHSGLVYRTPAEARASMEGVAMRAAA